MVISYSGFYIDLSCPNVLRALATSHQALLPGDVVSTIISWTLEEVIYTI